MLGLDAVFIRSVKSKQFFSWSQRTVKEYAVCAFEGHYFIDVGAPHNFPNTQGILTCMEQPTLIIEFLTSFKA